jgi:hypothetical protein
MGAVAMLRSPWTFQTQVQEHQGQLWMLEASVAPCKREQAEPWVAFLESLKGPVGTFLIGDPLARVPRGVAGGTPLVKGAGQTGEALETDGWTPSTTGILKAGDYIQVGQRLYKLKQDANSDGSGNSTLEIYPRLRESPADNAAIVTNAPVGLFRLNDAEIPLFEADYERLYSISFSAVEAI